jgi:hypothetical protein
MEEEKWKDIPEFEGLYKISNYGNVYSSYTKKQIKPQHRNDGRTFLIFRKDGKKYTRNIAPIVANAFVDNPDNFKYVKHKDGDLSNNYYKNLYWFSKVHDAKIHFKIGEFVDRYKKFIYLGEAQSKDMNHRKIKVKYAETGEIFETTMSDIRTGHVKYSPSLSKKMRNENRRVWKNEEIKNINGNSIMLLCDAGYRNKERLYYFKNLDTNQCFIESVTPVLEGNNLGVKGMSKGETKISSILKDININFNTQKKFNDCCSEKGNLLRFDFYLPDYNCCIEYDGEQHYKGWRKDKDSLKIIQERDNRKNQFCEDNDIKLLRIPYTDFNNITPEYLISKLNTIGVSIKKDINANGNLVVVPEGSTPVVSTK